MNEKTKLLIDFFDELEKFNDKLKQDIKDESFNLITTQLRLIELVILLKKIAIKAESINVFEDMNGGENE